ncbi:1-deoxy-D-xylulose-5-phosphate reductoisomerase [Salinarimonas soli]|uniref:1-deoxy-D-xylulose 5-phosphate reductoisomerase n=1 Tax=Salinarimonas soli TaxID=1638099 RepID=A0A5B2VEH1_9HYPH|nr:1-deoxy-D-xylulose-5-phosphate reductoisomerase [Salinarimonas soli]KAA2237016.1 1-deoxy-D-xylulose-5-phosphate reductoisomerase [Salinarimonas soli]
MSRPRQVTVLGATGSIGRSTADVLRAAPERFAVSALVGGRDAAALARQAVELRASFAALADPAGLPDLRDALQGTGIACGAGEAAVREAAERDADIVVAGISGVAGLAPTRAAMKPGRSLALANKECLVSAGEAFMADARRIGVTVLAMDSEHNALWQALQAGRREDVVSLTLTASGGPFRTWPADRIAGATAAQALKHPVWSMGAKISIDSATMMNKGLEIIEARHLFDVPPDRLEVLVHPQSIVHGLVQWRDGSVTAGLGAADMRIPIAHCLGEGGRLDFPGTRLDLAAIGALTFEAPDVERFPCLRLAREALVAGGAVPTVLNAANEVAVDAFVRGRIGFLDIAGLVDETCAAWGAHGASAAPTVEEALVVDHESRRIAAGLLSRRGS